MSARKQPSWVAIVALAISTILGALFAPDAAKKIDTSAVISLFEK